MDKGDRKCILVVDNSIAITGALKAIINATDRIKSDFEFIYIIPTKSSAEIYLKQMGLKFETLPFVEISKRPKDLIRYFPFLCLNGFKLKKLADKYRAEIIHMNDFYNLCGITAKLMGSKAQIVTHVRFLPQRFLPMLANTWARLNLHYASQVICVSEIVAKFFPKSEKIVIIPDTVPDREFHPQKAISDKIVKEINLLYLSNFIQGKGHEYALAAFKQAYKIMPSLRLTFAGHDMGLEKNKLFRQSLIRDVVDNQLEQVISFEPFVTDVEAKMKNADIFLNFSESESFSLTCLDALFYGTPLIASDCGGPSELFEHRKSGLLVPNRDVASMRDAILELANNVVLQAKFSKAGKDFVRNKFGPEKSFLKLRDLYSSLA